MQQYSSGQHRSRHTSSPGFFATVKHSTKKGTALWCTAGDFSDTVQNIMPRDAPLAHTVGIRVLVVQKRHSFSVKIPEISAQHSIAVLHQEKTESAGAVPLLLTMLVGLCPTTVPDVMTRRH